MTGCFDRGISLSSWNSKLGGSCIPRLRYPRPMNGPHSSSVKLHPGARVRKFPSRSRQQIWLALFGCGQRLRHYRTENPLPSTPSEWHMRTVHGQLEKRMPGSHSHSSWSAFAASGQGVYHLLQSGTASSRNWSTDPRLLQKCGLFLHLRWIFLRFSPLDSPKAPLNGPKALFYSTVTLEITRWRPRHWP